MAQDPLISEKESIKVEEASKKDAASFDAVQYIKKNKGKQFQHKEKANKDKESDDDNKL